MKKFIYLLGTILMLSFSSFLNPCNDLTLYFNEVGAGHVTITFTGQSGQGIYEFDSEDGDVQTQSLPAGSYTVQFVGYELAGCPLNMNLAPYGQIYYFGNGVETYYKYNVTLAEEYYITENCE